MKKKIILNALTTTNMLINLMPYLFSLESSHTQTHELGISQRKVHSKVKIKKINVVKKNCDHEK